MCKANQCKEINGFHVKHIVVMHYYCC